MLQYVAVCCSMLQRREEKTCGGLLSAAATSPQTSDVRCSPPARISRVTPELCSAVQCGVVWCSVVPHTSDARCSPPAPINRVPDEYIVSQMNAQYHMDEEF